MRAATCVTKTETNKQNNKGFLQPCYLNYYNKTGRKSQKELWAFTHPKRNLSLLYKYESIKVLSNLQIKY